MPYSTSGSPWAEETSSPSIEYLESLAKKAQRKIHYSPYVPEGMMVKVGRDAGEMRKGDLVMNPKHSGSVPILW